MPFQNPLALQEWFVNTFAGSWAIFTFVALVFITALAARFRMNNILLGIILTLFGIFMAQWIPWLYALTLIVMGFAISYIIARLIKT